MSTPLRPSSTRFIPACAGNTATASPSPTPPSVHPRVRGEHRASFSLRIGNFRFIPACAGNTAHFHEIAGCVSVHPRVRGEHAPLAVAGQRDRRFIPACAGNTGKRAPWRSTPAVHPRVRGEHFDRIAALHQVGGSSPRARGTLSVAPSHAQSTRFIPACAGNTGSSPSRSTESTVHPRVRGEHHHANLDSRDAPGSSPRARGTRARKAADEATVRFIPACAGNTPSSISAIAASTVHPRVRGEHWPVICSVTSMGGSSPRARGTLFP